MRLQLWISSRRCHGHHGFRFQQDTRWRIGIHGAFDGGSPGLFRPVIDVLSRVDRFFHAADFRAYADAQSRAAAAWRQGCFPAMSIRNVAGSGRFSSDRTVAQYAREIWEAVPVPPRPHP